MQIPSVTNTNIVLDPSFELITSTPVFVSPVNISVSSSVIVNEARSVNANSTSPFVTENVAVSELVGILLNNGGFKPGIRDTISAYDTLQIQLTGGTFSPPFVSPINIATSESVLSRDGSLVGIGATFSPMEMDLTIVKESVSVALQNVNLQPNIANAVTVYESLGIQISIPSGTTGWNTAGGATLTQISSDHYVGSYAAQLTSTGSSQYMYITLPCTISTAYVAQCYVKGTAAVVAKIEIVENAVSLANTTVTLDGSWDLLSLPSFITDGTHTTFDLRIYPTTSSTITVDAVIAQLANGAYPGYFDGDSGIGFAWTGIRADSTSTYTAFVALAASNFQSLPQFGLLIDWPLTFNAAAGFFTINVSAIGGSDFIPGTQTFPTFFDQYQYTDYSTYLLSNSIQYSLGQYPYGTFAAQMTSVLDNTTLLFMPGYDPVIGNFILPGRPIRFAIAFGGSSILQFSGTTIRPQNDLEDRTITLTAFDGMDYLNAFVSQGAGPLAAASNGVYVNVPAELIIGDLLSEAGFFTTQYVADQSLQARPIGYLAPKGQNIGAIIQSICEAEQGIFFFDENGVARFWNYQHIQSRQTPVWSFDYTQIVQFSLEDTPIINDVIVQAQPRVVEPNQLIWQLNSPTEIPAGGSFTVEADFQDSYGPIPVISVDAPVYVGSASTSNYATNFSSSGTDNLGIQSPPDGSQNYITVSSVQLTGSTYFVTFSNGNTSSVWILTLNLFGQPAKVQSVINQEYSSPISIALNGTNPANNGLPIVIQNDLIQNADTAQADAYMLVNNFANPYQRLHLDVFAVPQLQFGDAVSVTIGDTGQTLLYTVVGITSGISEDAEITQQLELNILKTTHYFTISVSAINGPDAISP